MQDFKKLRVWHLAHELSLKVIEALPPRRTGVVPGLRAQAVRAATSVPANLAEGCALSTRPEFLHFIEIALGSLNELEGHLLTGRDTGVLDGLRHLEIQNDLDLVRRMLLSLMRTLQRHIAEDESRRLESVDRPR